MGQRHGENRRVVNGGHQQTTTNGRTAAYQPNLLNQYEEGETPPYRDVRGTAHPRATVSIDGEKADRIPNGEFHHAVEIDNASGPAHEEITILGVRNHAGPGGEDVTDSQTGSLYLPANPETFTHDPDGNLTSDGQWTYIWNAENQLTAMETRPDLPATLERQRLEFTYDHQGKRVRKQTFDWNATSENFTPKADLWFIYHGWKLLAEGVIENSEFIIQTSHLWGHDLTGTFEGAGTVGGLLATTQHPNPSISNTYFLAYDGNGNVAAAINAATGDTEARFHYGPFGETLTATGPAAEKITHRFSTKYTDPETGLLYYGFRYLNLDTGRWLNRDPIAEEGGLNLYGFVGNDGINELDILGLSKCVCGPDVSVSLNLTLDHVRREFAALSQKDKSSVCGSMYGIDSWDIRELKLPITLPNRCGHADSDNLSKCRNHTVTVNGECHYAGAVNYILWGFGNSLCNTHIDTTLGSVKAWKFFTNLPFGLHHTYYNSVRWARAGYYGFLTNQEFAERNAQQQFFDEPSFHLPPPNRQQLAPPGEKMYSECKPCNKKTEHRLNWRLGRKSDGQWFGTMGPGSRF